MGRGHGEGEVWALGLDGKGLVLVMMDRRGDKYVG